MDLKMNTNTLFLYGDIENVSTPITTELTKEFNPDNIGISVKRNQKLDEIINVVLSRYFRLKCEAYINLELDKLRGDKKKEIIEKTIVMLEKNNAEILTDTEKLRIGRYVNFFMDTDNTLLCQALVNNSVEEFIVENIIKTRMLLTGDASKASSEILKTSHYSKLDILLSSCEGFVDMRIDKIPDLALVLKILSSHNIPCNVNFIIHTNKLTLALQEFKDMCECYLEI